jgi:hypothetical protein
MKLLRMGLISMAVLALAGSAKAQYSNDFTTLDGVTTFPPSGAPYLGDGGALADVNDYGYGSLYWYFDQRFSQGLNRHGNIS